MMLGRSRFSWQYLNRWGLWVVVLNLEECIVWPGVIVLSKRPFCKIVVFVSLAEDICLEHHMGIRLKHCTRMNISHNQCQ